MVEFSTVLIKSWKIEGRWVKIEKARAPVNKIRFRTWFSIIDIKQGTSKTEGIIF